MIGDFVYAALLAACLTAQTLRTVVQRGGRAAPSRGENTLELHGLSRKLYLLMGDDPPPEIENLLYPFLTSLFRRRLGILAAQGECLALFIIF